MHNKDLENLYFKVSSPEESSMIQEWLFSHGYKWSIDGQNLKYLDKPTLVTWDDGFICYSTDDDFSGFERYTKAEVTFGVISHKIHTPELHWIGDTPYIKSEYDQAISALKPYINLRK